MLVRCMDRTEVTGFSLMIVTAERRPIRTADASGSGASEKISIDPNHRVGHSAQTHHSVHSLLFEEIKKFLQLFGYNLRVCLLWVTMKPAVVLLGLALLLDTTFGAEGKTDWRCLVLGQNKQVIAVLPI